MTGVPVRWFWSSGDEVKPTEIKSDPFMGGQYSLDFAMYHPAPSYGFEIADGLPSDAINGLGLGSIEQPNYNIHTCYFFEIQRMVGGGGTEPEPGPEPPAQGGALLWPVDGPITHPFGAPPASFGQVGHGGIDIAVPTGTFVLAVADGEVMYTGWDDDYGNYLRCWHPQLHMHSFYAHLAEVKVSVGLRVQRGQVLALSGNSGNSTGSHLHLEFRGGTRDSYYNVTYGYNQGRFDPRTIYLVTGAPLAPGASL
jgi:murein DD-endopeptidase MepM/ murein hydrolase activator NlpD